MPPVFDGHNDALTKEGYTSLAERHSEGHLDVPRMREGGVQGAIFAVFTESPGAGWVPVPRDDDTVEMAMADPVPYREAAAFSTIAAGRLAELERWGHVRIARTIADVDAARDDGGPPVAVLHFEGAEPIDPGFESLELWYAAGLRSIGLVWSRPNDFGHGVPFIWPSSPDTGPGLTPAGQALIRRCAALGILIDLSHLNEAGFWDVQRAELGPLVASHSGVHALCASSRNLTDRQLDAIGESGGLVGIVYACPFLRPDFADDPDTPIELIGQHAAYVAERIGVEHVALGSDYDGATVPAELGGVAGTPKVLDALRAAGFSESDLEAVAWDNWRRVLETWWR